MRQLTKFKSLTMSIALLFLSIGLFGLGVVMLFSKIGLEHVLGGTLASQLAVMIYGLSLFDFDRNNFGKVFENKIDIKSVLIAIGITVVIFMINMILGQFVSNDPDNMTNSELIVASKSILVSFILPIIIAPVFEELTFRAGLRHLLVDKGSWNSSAYVLISSLIFGLLHFSPTLVGITHMGLTTVIGVAFGLVYVKTDNIYISIMSHMTYNGIIVAFATFIV